jgi:hypothetical protein
VEPPNPARLGLDISPERWPEVSRVFAAALGLDGPARLAYLEEACGDDRSLRNAVDSMIAAHDSAGTFGEAPVRASTERLEPGSQIGPFLVERLLGSGGMGEVYRAHDTKLRRDVALKVLPDSVANDPDRRSRFGEEAQALAALNHPRIGAIYGLEESGTVAALVLELVEGPTLAERLTAGPLSVDEVVRIARQIAEGLEAAHERGIVHRDLKPANVKITPEGDVKILDFGLAKVRDSPPREAPADTRAPSRQATALGAIVGTAGYMSPEQAQGQPVDRRTDIWAFGCVLFEMCALRQAFTGATVSDTLRAVVEQEPDWAALPGDTPLPLARLLRRCLTKDSKLRLRDIGEARIALLAGQDADAADRQPPRARGRAVLLAGAGLLALVSLLAIALYRPTLVAPSEKIAPVQFLLSPPEGSLFPLLPGRIPFAMSPDGSRLAFVAAGGSAGPGSRIWLRALSDLEARPLPGTDNALNLFWSPDGRSLAFFADNKVKRIDLPAGAVVTVCEAPGAAFSHGSWGTGVMLIGRGDGTEIRSVPASGGVALPVVTRSMGEARVHWPWFLPDGKRFVYTARLDNGDGEVRLGQIDGATRPLVRASSNAQWVDPDIVVFARDGVLMGQRVNLDSARPIGEPFAVADKVEYYFTTTRAMFSVSRTGALAYHGGGALQQLVWVDRSGREVGTVGDAGDYAPSARLSRDQNRLLLARRQGGLGTYDIWRLDLDRNTQERLTVNPGSDMSPVWTEDERAIVYSADSPGTVPHLFRMDLATGASTELLPPGTQQHPMDVFPGGRVLGFTWVTEGGYAGLFRKSLESNAPPVPLLESRQNIRDMRLAPDGRAVAYMTISDEQQSVYIAPLPPTRAPKIVAEHVSGPPRWSADGREVYFVAGDEVISVGVRTTPRLEVGALRPLFQLKQPRSSLLLTTRDGRFLILVPLVEAGERPIVVSTAGIDPTRRD